MPDCLQLVDASSVIFRAWFGRPEVSGTHGYGRSALDGWLQFLWQLQRHHSCEMGVVAFDESLGTGFRHRIYSGYKANRSLPDEDLGWQLQQCKQIAEALGWRVLVSEEYEADDLIASSSKLAFQQQLPCMIWSQDKDLIQCLLQEQDRLIRVDRKGERSRQSVFEEFGLRPEQWVDFQALTGDAVDGIPGVPGIGPSAATHLLQCFDDLDNIYSNLDRVPEQPWRSSARHASLLAQHQDSAELSRQLATLADDALPFAGVDEFQRRAMSDLPEVLQAAGFGPQAAEQWYERFAGADPAGAQPAAKRGRH